MAQLANRIKTAATDAVPAKKAKGDDITIPNREQLCEHITAALSEGRKLEDLTAAQVMGITDARIQQAERANVPFTPPTIDLYYKRSRAALEQPISEGRHLTVAGAGGRQWVQEEVSKVFEDANMYGIMEVNPCPGDKRILAYIPEGWLLMQFPETYSDKQLEYNGESIDIANDDIISKFQTSKAWTIINAPWDGTDQPVAAVKTTDCGKAMVIFLNLFGTKTGRWMRPSGKNTDTTNRKEILSLILDAAKPHLTAITFKPTQSPIDEQIREAASTFAAIKTLGVASLGRVDQELREAKDQVTQLRENISRAQGDLIDAIRREADNTQKIDLLSHGRDGRIMAALTTAIGSLDKIQAMRPILEARFEERNGQPALYVVLRDLVIGGGRDAKDKRLVKSVKFWIKLDRGGRDCIEFDNRNIDTATVHPHVMRGNQVCWGNAANPIAQAVGRNDWVAVVNLTVLWARQYSYTDHNTHTDFPKTDLPVGWVGIDDK